MKLDQVSTTALLQTLFQSAEKLRAERNQWKDLPLFGKILVGVMTATFVASLLWYIFTAHIGPLLIVVGLCCIVAFGGMTANLKALENLTKESEEYQIAVDLLIDNIEGAWNKASDFNAIVIAALATIHEFGNDVACSENDWTVGELRKLTPFGEYLVLTQRLIQISQLIYDIRKEQSDVEMLIAKMKATEDQEKLQSQIDDLFNSAIDTLKKAGLYKEGMDATAAIQEAAKLLRTPKNSTPESAPPADTADSCDRISSWGNLDKD